jgi:hypothetical protein
VIVVIGSLELRVVIGWAGLESSAQHPIVDIALGSFEVDDPVYA